MSLVVTIQVHQAKSKIRIGLGIDPILNSIQDCDIIESSLSLCSYKTVLN